MDTYFDRYMALALVKSFKRRRCFNFSGNWSHLFYSILFFLCVCVGSFSLSSKNCKPFPWFLKKKKKKIEFFWICQCMEYYRRAGGSPFSHVANIPRGIMGQWLVIPSSSILNSLLDFIFQFCYYYYFFNRHYRPWGYEIDSFGRTIEYLTSDYVLWCCIKFKLIVLFLKKMMDWLGKCVDDCYGFRIEKRVWKQCLSTVCLLCWLLLICHRRFYQLDLWWPMSWNCHKKYSRNTRM